MITAIVPVKALTESKRRLAGALAPAMRERLVLAMLDHVLFTLMSSPSIHDTLVVTPDPDVARLAREAGVAVLAERDTTDLNTAIREGLAEAARRKATAALVIPADVPFVTVADIERLAAAGRAHTAPYTILVPDLGRGGTNALLASLPTALELRFGPDSLARHVDEAQRSGIPHEVLELGGLARDIDEPGDLAALTRPGPAAARYAFLEPGSLPPRADDAREGAASCMSGVSNA